MSAKVEPGTYQCKTTGATIYEAPSGAVMCRIAVDIGLTGGICLIQKDGTLSERGFKDAMAIFGLSTWDWVQWERDPAEWAGRDVEAVVETVQGEKGEFSSVKYLNPPGGGGMALTKADGKALAAKYGAKTRALLGGTPAAPKVPPKAPTPPPAPPKAPPVLPPAPQGKSSTIEECWEGFCGEQENAGKAEHELYHAWHARIEQVTGKKQNDCTPEDWGRVRASLNILI
jgi:hypothetical protein